ncbi:MAG TPA: PaaI family thioesterase [Candidatus Aminicenantes bacterium]|nr:PaaI family thioesterase [Candidatus Aminicenantes bacterium]
MDAFKQRLTRPGHFHNHLGMRLVNVRKGWARMEMAVTAELINIFGQVHGGALFALVDTAMGAALAGLLETGEGMTTVEAKINYIRPVTEKIVVAEAAVLHRGRRTAVLEARVMDGSGLAAAQALGTYLVLESADGNVSTPA